MDHVDTLAGLGPKQRVRLRFADDSSVEGRVNQRDYTRSGYLRLELAVDDDNGRYQVLASFEDGRWTPVEVRRFPSATPGEKVADTGWTTLGDVTEVTPLEDSMYPASDGRFPGH